MIAGADVGIDDAGVRCTAAGGAGRGCREPFASPGDGAKEIMGFFLDIEGEAVGKVAHALEQAAARQAIVGHAAAPEAGGDLLEPEIRAQELHDEERQLLLASPAFEPVTGQLFPGHGSSSSRQPRGSGAGRKGWASRR